MNREMRRKLDKQARKKMTTEQYKEFTSDTVVTYANQEVEKMSAKVIADVAEILPIVLRKNRISEDRTSKILSDFSEAFREKYKEVFVDERLSEQGTKEPVSNIDGSKSAD